MNSSPATLEVDLRRRSPQALLLELEKAMGLRFNLRRARVTPRRAWLLLEVMETPAVLASSSKAAI